MSKQAAEPRRLIHFTPLRYPGGKAKLAAYVKEIIKQNKLYDSEYAEPYAGGAGIALELLFQEYVHQIRINDVSHHVYSFWKSVLNDTEELCRLVKNTKLSIGAWDRQKRIFSNPDDHDYVQVGFATFFLNRTNRSGILNGGVIGGRDQTGPWKIDARYNADELIFRIESIAKMKKRIKLTNRDAISFLKFGLPKWPDKGLVYLDPPYYERGRELYYDYYKPEDHADVANLIGEKMKGRNWIVSYDNVAAIKKLYSAYRSITYNVGYSARDQYVGKEVMFFSPKLIIPDLVGPVKQIGKVKMAA
ncbi:site-specific DNA methylase [Bradyrhizobium sp. YR681]|uniref:DNA adenine methylase n=1 Tax=Bradyrhizobium sp. YR681 TaxID=1144344 RepID=UPI00027140E9|nr:DNA adenine methylase [Bradyrhizobium sp. YR681]EJN14595.1 site-specific DNA methylase [Bradyrhizobium sp. YR681]